MFELCMFDLDDTLVRTEDLKGVREACKHSVEPARLKAVRNGLASKPDRHIYSLALLQKIRAKHPKLKLGIFTRSPHSYADAVLAWAYPGFAWDIIVGYEDVKPTKPHGDGIDLAMAQLGIKYVDHVMMVGDNDADVRAAYNCGCLVALDKTAWPNPRLNDHWYALGRIPDALIDSPAELLDVLADADRFLPELERLLAEAEKPAFGYRFDKINHFIPRELGAERPYPVYVCGRSFASYKSIKYRKLGHALTESIEEHKDADDFPDEWIDAIRHFITSECAPSLFAPAVKVLVTVVPHRPERTARLESLLAQLKESITDDPIAKREVSVAPDLLAYKDGVKSQHHEFLNQQDRFTNVRDHLFVKRPALVKPGVCIVVIDDVCTTGASLIYATKYLRDVGARDVKCLALAKNIGDVLAWN